LYGPRPGAAAHGNCTWPCHRQRLVGLAGSDAVVGAGGWAVLETGELGNALPMVWSETTPNVENPVVIPAAAGGAAIQPLLI
jgi:hypothetical protein